MSRNRKPEYINRIRHMEVPNGYKFDIANYLMNPSLDYDYPSFIKVIKTEGETETIRRVYYFKYYDGTGEYLEEIFTHKISGESKWEVVSPSRKTLESGNRFNIKKLISFC